MIWKKFISENKLSKRGSMLSFVLSLCLLLVACSSMSVTMPRIYQKNLFEMSSSIESSRLYYVNGLATTRQSADNNLYDRIKPAIVANEEGVRNRLEESVNFKIDDNSSYFLAYNIAIGEVIEANSNEPLYQIVASTAQKLQEAGISENNSWQIARAFLDDPNFDEVIRGAAGQGIVATYQGVTDVITGTQSINPISGVLNLVQNTLRNTAQQRLENALARVKENFDAIADYTRSSEVGFVNSVIPYVESGGKVITISNSQGTLFTGLGMRKVAEKLGERVARCNYSGVQVANMMGSAISTYNDQPLYVTFSQDRVVNVVRRTIEAANASANLNPEDLNPDNWFLSPPMIGNANFNCLLQLEDPLQCHRLDVIYLNPSFEARRKIFQMLGDAAETLNPTSNQCLELEIEKFNLTPVTQSGEGNLEIRMRLVDANGKTILDQDFNRPPVKLTFEIGGGFFPGPGAFNQGETASDGYFRSRVKMNEDADKLVVSFVAKYSPEDEEGNPVGEPLITVPEEDRQMLRIRSPQDCPEDFREYPDCVFLGGSGPPTPTPIPCPNCGKADGVGDPHLYTLDRLRYDFHGVGESILSQSVVPELDFQLQARFRPFGSSSVA